MSNKNQQFQNQVIKLNDLNVLAEEVGLANADWFVKGVRKLSKNWNDYFYSHLVKQCINHSNISPVLNTEFPGPISDEDKELVKGEYHIGFIYGTDIPVGLTKKQLNIHCMVIGKPGKGKTTLINSLADSILKKKI